MKLDQHHSGSGRFGRNKKSGMKHRVH